MSVITPKIEMGLPLSPLELSPVLWLRTDSFAGLADGADVTGWVDSSGNGRHLDVSVGAQTYYKDVVNGRPAIWFDDDGYLYADNFQVLFKDIDDPANVGHYIMFTVALVTAGHVAKDVLWATDGGLKRGQWVDEDDYLVTRAWDGSPDAAQGDKIMAGAWHLFVSEYDGTNVQHYEDNVDAPADQAASGAQLFVNEEFFLGGEVIDGNYLKGYIAEHIIFPTGAMTVENRRRLAWYFERRFRLETGSTPPATEWTDVSEDVVSSVSCGWGVHGDGPKDRLAEPGTMSFSLDNSMNNSDGTRGYYSPGHGVAVRTGFGIGADVRLSLTHELHGTKVKWVGTVESAKPLPGVKDPRTVVKCVDWMEEARAAKLSGLPVQVDTQSDALFATVVAAMDAQPPGGTSIASGSDEYPYALDNAQDEKSKVSSELLKIMLSEYGIAYVDAGVLYFEGRRRRGGAGSVRLALDETNIVKLGVTHGRGDILNRIQVSIHPRRVDSAPTTVLFNLRSAIRIERNTSVTINCPYRDPNQPEQRCGGVEMVTPVAVTDYAFTENEDGSGADLTAQLDVDYVDPPPGGNSAEVLLTNNGPLDGYVPDDGLRLRGKGLYDFEPVLSDIRDQDSIDEYGENAFGYDMPYQSSPANAHDMAQFILALHKDEGTRARTVQFVANWSDDLVEQAFNLQVSDKVSVTMAEVGLDAAQFFVNGFRMTVKPSGLTVMTLDLTPVDTTQFWLLEVDGRTELDETTVLGYGLFVPGWILDSSELGTDTFLS